MQMVRREGDAFNRAFERMSDGYARLTARLVRAPKKMMLTYAGLIEATERLNREFTDEAYAEQQRLLKRKLEFDSRLGQMASARAALPSGDASNTTAE